MHTMLQFRLSFPNHTIRDMTRIALVAVLASIINPPPVASADSSGIRMLEEIQGVIIELAEKTKPSVVNLFPVTGTPRAKEGTSERTPNASGSGSDQGAARSAVGGASHGSPSVPQRCAIGGGH